MAKILNQTRRSAEFLLRFPLLSPSLPVPAGSRCVVSSCASALLAGLLSVSGGCAAHVSPAASLDSPVRQAELAVVTWNMDAGRGDLPRLIADVTSGRLSGSPPRAYALLLQEALDRDGSPAPTLGRVQQPGLSMFFAPVREVGGRLRGNAIVASLPLVDAHPIPLPRERQPRAAVVARVVVGGEPLFIVSAHLENRLSWRRGGLFSESARGRQAAALVAALPPGTHGIVGGDLNTWLGPAEPAWKELLRRFPDTPPRPPTDATFRRRLILDHLFFDLPDGWQIRRRVLPEAYGSDHTPVLGLLYR